MGLTSEPWSGGELVTSLSRRGSETRWTVAPSLLIQPREALGVAVGGRLFLTRGPVDRTRGDLRASLALRPDGSPWMTLNRLDLIVLNESGGSSDIREWRIIDNLHVNRRIGSRLQATVQYGGKYVEQTLMGQFLSGYTDLWDYHAGLSAGYILARGVWLQGGYNPVGFEDEGFSGSASTTQGPYLRLSARLDTDALSRLGFGDQSELRGTGRAVK